MSSAPRPPFSAARIVYAGIVASTSIITLGALTTTFALGTATTAVGVPDAVALVAGAAAFIAGIGRGRAVGRPRSDQLTDQWWHEQAGAMLVAWGLMELTAIIGAITTFTTGRLTGFAALAAVGLTGLVAFYPRRGAAG